VLVTALALVRPTVRAIRWLPGAGAAGLGLVIVAVPALSSVRLRPDDLTDLLRVAAVCGAVGLAFLLDDPAARSTETVPVPLLVERVVRLAVGLPLALAWWAVTVAVTVAGAAPGTGAPVREWSLTLEAGALFAAALALAALGGRFAGGAGGGTFAGPAVFVFAAIASQLPDRIALYVPADLADWSAARVRWVAVLVVALLAFVAATRRRTA